MNPEALLTQIREIDAYIASLIAQAKELQNNKGSTSVFEIKKDIL